MSRLMANGCNITGQEMIWSVKCILSCPRRSNFNKSYTFYRQIGFKIFQVLNNGRRTLDSGRWALVAGLCTLDSGRWTIYLFIYLPLFKVGTIDIVKN